jgi:hypothetical protein
MFLALHFTIKRLIIAIARGPQNPTYLLASILVGGIRIPIKYLEHYLIVNIVYILIM